MLIVVAVLSRKISNFRKFFCCIESVLPDCEHTHTHTRLYNIYKNIVTFNCNHTSKENI